MRYEVYLLDYDDRLWFNMSSDSKCDIVRYAREIKRSSWCYPNTRRVLVIDNEKEASTYRTNIIESIIINH